MLSSDWSQVVYWLAKKFNIQNIPDLMLNATITVRSIFNRCNVLEFILFLVSCLYHYANLLLVVYYYFLYQLQR